MKKIALLIVFTSLAALPLGCKQIELYDEYKGPAVFEEMTPSAENEVALAESVAQKRLEYRNELEKIKSFYEQSGNQLKIEWVDRELKFINDAPRYHYVIEAEVAGGDLRAKTIIPKANAIYEKAKARYESVCIFPMPGAQTMTGKLLVSRRRMQIALNGFNEVIKDYPTSDKIDDCAYYAGKIHEFFGDDQIAALYYKRAFQWNPATPYPARYNAAILLDDKLAQRDEALKLYKAALDREEAYLGALEVSHAEKRVQQLSGGGDSNSLPKE